MGVGCWGGPKVGLRFVMAGSVWRWWWFKVGRRAGSECAFGWLKDWFRWAWVGFWLVQRGFRAWRIMATFCGKNLLQLGGHAQVLSSSAVLGTIGRMAGEFSQLDFML